MNDTLQTYAECDFAAIPKKETNTVEVQSLMGENALLRNVLMSVRNERDYAREKLAKAQLRADRLQIDRDRYEDAAWHARWEASVWRFGFIAVNVVALGYIVLLIASR